MSLTLAQNAFRASSSTVLTTIDTNSGSAGRPFYSNDSPYLISPAKSSLSPYAAPYKPQSIRSSHLESQHRRLRSSGARAGRGIPAAASSIDIGVLTVTGSAVEPMLHKIPTYQSSPRFNPFGDSAPELLQSHSSPADSLLTQPFRPGTGTKVEPTYTHYYYYDTNTNRPTLAYGIPPATRHDQPSTRTRSTSNHRAAGRGNGNLNNNAPKSLNINPRRPTIVVNTAQTPSRSPSPPSPTMSPSVPSVIPFPVTERVQDAFADPVVSVTPAPAPIRTRKRSNTISEGVSVPSNPSRAPSPKKSDATASKLVAAMLLNRVDLMGRSRCSKRVTQSCGTRYVKSGLSHVVFVEC